MKRLADLRSSDVPSGSRQTRKHKGVMGTNPENEAQPKVNECIALNGPSDRPFIESAHNLHELASHQNDRAPQYEGNTIE